MSQLTDNLNLIASIKSDIKSAIENKGVDMTGVSFPGYASKIGEISGGGGVDPSGTLEISENGVYNVYSYSSASVDVHPSTSLSETYISNGNYNITGEFNGGVIKVDVPAPQFVTETLNVSSNGTYTPGQGVDGYSQVVVDVPQSVTGYTEKDVTENNFGIINLNNSASFVAETAFSENNQLQTVYLPNCVTVNNWAFAFCRNLTSVNLPNCTTFSGNHQFYYNISLSQIYVPLLKNVPNYAFGECYNLRSIDLPEATYIGNSAFYRCSLLSQINIPKVSVISEGPFSECNSLKSIYAPECISFSGGLQFNMCKGLETVDFPILYSMSNYTFNSCHKLVSVSMPLLLRINNNTFKDCSALSELNLPLLYIFESDRNFYNCSSLEKISFPLLFISADYSYYANQGFSTCSSLKEVTLGTGLYFVPEYVSLGSYFITNNGVINIDAEMYDKWLSASGWSSMSSHFRSYVSTNSDPLLSVSNGVLYGRTKALIQGQASVDWKTYVSDVSTIVNVSLPECELMFNCFEYNSHIKTIYLPKVKILPNAMSLKYGITSIYFGELELMSTITYLDKSCSVTIATSKVCKCLSTTAFWDSVPSIYVPASLVDAYKSAPAWSNISSNIFPIPE